jgi:hypothetical protein
MEYGNCSLQLSNFRVYTYEDNYMTKFELDPEHLTPKRPFKIGDLMNCLPYGKFFIKE